MNKVELEEDIARLVEQERRQKSSLEQQFIQLEDQNETGQNNSGRRNEVYSRSNHLYLIFSTKELQGHE